MANSALRWILDQEEVTCAIPGFKNANQVEDNLKAIQTKPFSEAELDRLHAFYVEEVHEFIRGAY